MIALHNLSPEPAVVPIDLGRKAAATKLIDLLRDDSAVTDASGRVELALEGYGYRWLRSVGEGEKRLF
jgi:hypothetical protein